MANIRTLSDSNKNEVQQSLDMKIDNLGGSLITGGTTNPLHESFFQMLHINVCPYISLISFAILMSLVTTTMFGIQVATSGVKLDGEFLEINKISLTETLSASYGSVVEKRQIWRLLSFWLVHPSFPKLINAVIMMIIWGSYIEKFFGFWRLSSVFFLSTIAGGAFGILFATPVDYLMGSTIGLFGLLGAAIGFLVFNWYNISENRFPKVFMLWMMIILIIFSLVMSSSTSAFLLSVGGILSGLFCGIFLSPRYTKDNQVTFGYSNYERILWATGISLYGLFLLISLFFIWILRKKSLL